MEYTNSQIKELISEHIHVELDRKMLYLRLARGMTFARIAELVRKDEKTVRKHIRAGEEILFKHL